MTAFANASERISALTDGLIDSLDKLTLLRTGGGAAGEPETFYVHKDARSMGAATPNMQLGVWNSLFNWEGSPIGHAAVPPLPGAVPTRTTQGALGQADAGGGRTKLLINALATAGSPGSLLIYDRLWHCSGLDASITTVQNVNGGASGDVTRYTDGVGNLLCIEVYATLGGTNRVLTAVYKDGAGATQTSLSSYIGSLARDNVGYMWPIALAGSTVKGVTSVSIPATTGAAGNFGVTIIHPLLAIPVGATNAVGGLANFLCACVPQIQPGACLGFAFIPSQSVRATVDAFLMFTEA